MADDTRSRVGCSKFSLLKWERLDYFLSVHVPMCRGVFSRCSWCHPGYVYVDLYAGPGFYPEDARQELRGQAGSPLITIRAARRFGVMPECHLVEPAHADRLRRSLESAGLPEAVGSVMEMECRQAAEELAARYASSRKVFGLVFVDPNGYPCYETLGRLVTIPAFDTIDYLIHLNASINKRCYYSTIHPETMRPTDHLRSLGKRSIYLWRPHPSNPQQFTLAYCTNGPFPEFRNLGFHHIDSDKGRQIARLIDYRPGERRSLGSLPGFLPGLELD